MPAISFTVNRTGDLTRTGSVDWALSGTLQVPADLAAGQATSGSVSWLANEATAKMIVINTRGNTADNPDRACTIILSNPVNGTLGAAQATTTVVDDDTTPGVTPTGYPYPRSDTWREITFPNALTRIYATTDQHPTSPFADGSICDLGLDWGPAGATPTTMEVARLTFTGSFPAGPWTVGRRANWGAGLPHASAPPAGFTQNDENLKAHAVVVLPNNRVVLYYYRLWETNGREFSTCMLSTDNGVSFEATPPLGNHLFDLGRATDNFQPRGIIQPSPGYGATGAPPASELDRNYFYVAGNNTSQGGTRFGANSGLIYLCRYQHQGTGAPTLNGANLRNRNNYAFFTGLVNGVQTWTANGGLKTVAGVTPIFRNIINGATVDFGYFWQCHWHPLLGRWIATWCPQGDRNRLSVACATSLWNNSWQMLANNVDVTRLPAGEKAVGGWLGASAPAAWGSATSIGIGLSTFVGSPRAGDDLILTNSSTLVAL